MKNLFFSIVIPTLNEEKYLPGLLKDLENQTVNGFEVIVADGDSEDKTREKALLFRKSLHLKIVIGAKKSAAVQRNSGGMSAQGEYIVFLDADSRIPEDFLEKLRSEIVKSKADFASTYIKIKSLSKVDHLVVKGVNVLFKSMLMLGKPCMTGSCLIFKKDVFIRLKGFDETVVIGEDYEIVRRYAKYGFKGVFFSDPFHYFSLRRVSREGKFSVVSKYTISFIHELIFGPIKKSLFSYPMGGKIEK